MVLSAGGQPSLGAAESNKNMSRVPSSGFLFSLEGEHGEALEGGSNVSGQPAQPYSGCKERILANVALLPGEQHLMAALNAAKAAAVARSPGSKPDLWAVASELRSRHGYAIKVRHGLGGKRKNYLRALRHSFLILPCGVEGNEGTDILLDLGFRDHFVLPWADPAYEELLSALPQDWVGPLDRLAAVVSAASSAMRVAFKLRGKPLPPWREPRALLSKWIPEWWEDQQPQLVALPQAMAPGACARARWSDHGAGSGQPACGRRDVPGAFGNASRWVAAKQQALGPATSLPASEGGLGRQPSLPPLPVRSKSDTARPMPDVPRKIIVGFPSRDQEQPAAVALQSQAVAQAAPCAPPATPPCAPAAPAPSAYGVAAGGVGDRVRPGHIAAWAAGLQRAAASVAAAAVASGHIAGAAAPRVGAAVHDPFAAQQGLASFPRPAGARAVTSNAADHHMGSAARLYKALDQLLPPVRVVKLGAG